MVTQKRWETHDQSLVYASLKKEINYLEMNNDAHVHTSMEFES